MTGKYFIIDSCILFDLLDVELFDEFCKLNSLIITSPFVIEEIKDKNQQEIINRYINNFKIEIDQNTTIEAIQEYQDEFPGFSFTDCSVLELAIRNGGTLLTSDKSLKYQSNKRDITVHGMIMPVFAKLFGSNVILSGIISSEESVVVVCC
jgi:predicted nucleic acid-binding protein